MMVRYDVAIATTNPKVMYLIVELVKSLGLSFIHCNTSDYQCRQSRAIVTTQSEAVNKDIHRSVIVDTDFNPDTTTIDIMVKILAISDPPEFMLGIDPGMQYGIALLMNGTAVHSKKTQSPQEAARCTLLWSRHIQEKYNQEILIRVGTGSRLYSVLYLRAIKEEGNMMPIELVDERHTTLVGGSDQSSAILIALRKGQSITESDFILEPKEGYVKSLKRFVERFTGGRRKLSTQDAHSVLLDETTLETILTGTN
jgi:hypothetical protein